MAAMLAAVTPRLRTGAKLLSLSIHVNAPEGTIAPHLSAAQADYADVQMGSYPYFDGGRPGVYLVLRSVDQERLDAAARGLEARLQGGGLAFARRAPDDGLKSVRLGRGPAAHLPRSAKRPDD